jgi:hypothetical protein
MAEAPPRFAADRMLQQLARWLRILGADVSCDPSMAGAEALYRARAEGRIFLTRDKRLRTAPEALYVETQLFRDQLREVIARYSFDARRFAFTRCSECNTILREVDGEVVVRQVPPFVYASHEKFAVCDTCNRVYWDGTHPARALAEIASLGLATSLG